MSTKNHHQAPHAPPTTYHPTSIATRHHHNHYAAPSAPSALPTTPLPAYTSLRTSPNHRTPNQDLPPIYSATPNPRTLASLDLEAARVLGSGQGTKRPSRSQKIYPFKKYLALVFAGLFVWAVVYGAKWEARKHAHGGAAGEGAGAGYAGYAWNGTDGVGNGAVAGNGTNAGNGSAGLGARSWVA